MEIWTRIKFAFQWTSISLLTDVKLVEYVRWLNDIKISCVLFLKGHSQLWDRVDLDTNFLTLKRQEYPTTLKLEI